MQKIDTKEKDECVCASESLDQHHWHLQIAKFHGDHVMNPICLDLVRDDADIPQYPRTQSNYEASGGTTSTPHNPSTCLHVSASLPRTSRSAFTFT